MTSFLPPATLLLALAAVSLPAQVMAQRAQAPADTKPRNELDAVMEKALAQRDVNRQTLRQYILDEAEEFEVLGPGRWPLYRTKREFTWYLRDGVHVRSPLRFDGVKVTDDERDRYERNWLSRERNRQEEREKKRKEKEITVGPQGVEVVSPGMPAEPRFVSEAYFMDFKFEPGNYYLAGREKLEGKDVLKIEYYPTGMFGDDDERDRGDRKANREKDGKEAQEDNAKKNRDSAKDKEFERNIERRMNKTALITLWIDPAEHQIVKYTFDNVWLDFLPGAWLVRVDDMRASMTMGQPFPGVWLPREMNIHAGVTLANGSFEAGYGRAFSEYREADVKSRIRVPKEKVLHENRPGGFAPPDPPSPSLAGAPLPRSAPAGAPTHLRGALQRVLNLRDPHDGLTDGSFPPNYRPQVLQTTALHTSVLPDGFFLGDSPRQVPAAAETVGEIRVHGNTYLTDDDVIRLAGVAVGKTLNGAEIEAIRKRLEDSGRFDTVDVRKRYRSLTDTTDIALVLLVHERPGIRSVDDGISAVLNPIRRRRAA